MMKTAPRQLIKGMLPGFAKRLFKKMLAAKGPFTVKICGKRVRMVFTGRWIEKDLFLKGISGYEKSSIQIWLALAAQADTVLDIGANTGLFSLVAQTVNPRAKVWGFEPLQEFNQTFTKNCRMNGYPIQVARVALSNFSGKASFYVPEEEGGNVYSSSLSLEHYSRHQQTKPKEFQVDVVLGDDFIRDKKITNIDLVKIDAEGHDAEVLEGLKETIRTWHPDFLLEIQSDEIGEKMMQALPASEYEYFVIDEENGLEPIARLGRGSSLNALAAWRGRPRMVAMAKMAEMATAK